MTIFNDFPVNFPNGSFNELYLPDGSFRPECLPFVSAIDSEGLDKLLFYAEQTNRLFASEMPSVKADTRFFHGFIPFFLSVEDFELLEKGLIQRAQILNAALSDLYGAQRLLKEGVLPPEILFASKAYLPALKNIIPADGVFLKEYTVDVERAEDGRFWVVDEKTQMPLNIGLTIKNRLLLSRVMPDIYARTAPKRILSAVQNLSEQLTNLVKNESTPCLVLLVPSTQKGVGFENAFLARNLGISIVEPADLSVRNDTVYLKNMNGLKKVDLILRYIDDYQCDSLELNGASAFGVAGLTQAVRAGTVKIVNPLGSGIAEIPAMKAFIHGIARFFTHTDLILPSLAAWWCGQPKELNYVLAHRNALHLCDAQTGAEIDAADEIIKSAPEKYLATETVNASYTPVFYKNEILPARARLRLHLTYDDGVYKMMPGGTAFSKIRKDTLIQDIWVLNGKKKTAPLTVASTAQRRVSPVRSTFDLTSHTAENMFWLGRYLERSEDMTRLMRAILRRAVDNPELPEPNDTATLYQTLAWLGYIGACNYASEENQKHGFDAVLKLISDKNEAFGLPVLFKQIKETSDKLHDRLSMDTWEIFTKLKQYLPEPSDAPRVALNRLESIILQQNALSGLIRENMTREISWRFMEIGRRLERGIHVLDLMNAVDLCARNGFSAALDTLLEVSDSRMTYRSRYLSVPAVPLVFDLLICDETNPRALIYQVMKLLQNTSKIALESKNALLFENEKKILQDIIETVKRIDVATLAQNNSLFEEAPLNPKVAETITSLRKKMTEFSDLLTLSCFVHAGQTRQGPVYG